MNQYGRVALKAYDILVNNEVDCSKKAWEKAMIIENVSKKLCAKSAFVALTEFNLLINCQGPKQSLNQEVNKWYTFTVVNLLKNNPKSDSSTLLYKLKLDLKKEKTQFVTIIDVVSALWNANYIEKSIDLKEEIERLRKKINPTVVDILGDLDI